MVYKFIQEDIVLKLQARVNSEGIGGGDAAGHSRNGNLGGDGVRGRECKEGCKGGCNSGEKGFRSSVKEVCFFFFLFPSFLSAVVARVVGAILEEIGRTGQKLGKKHGGQCVTWVACPCLLHPVRPPYNSSSSHTALPLLCALPHSTFMTAR